MFPDALPLWLEIRSRRFISSPVPFHNCLIVARKYGDVILELQKQNYFSAIEKLIFSWWLPYEETASIEQ